MKRLLLSLFGAAFLFSASGCGGENPLESQKNEQEDEEEEEEFPPIDTTGYSCPPESVVTWENFASGWVTRQCVACHSIDLQEGERADAPVGVDFNTYEMVRAWGTNMFWRAGYDNVTMPPAGGPYPEDRILFGDWMACQAPRESDLDQ